MPSDFLGVGWRLPVQPDANGQIGMVFYEESVHQSIWTILGTAPGERVMRPEFGCGIHDLVFAVNRTSTAGLVARAVREALIRWEPRIDDVRVSVEPDDRQPTCLLIQIEYRVRSTNNRFNLVFPFYLE